MKSERHERGDSLSTPRRGTSSSPRAQRVRRAAPRLSRDAPRRETPAGLATTPRPATPSLCSSPKAPQVAIASQTAMTPPRCHRVAKSQAIRRAGPRATIDAPCGWRVAPPGFRMTPCLVCGRCSSQPHSYTRRPCLSIPSDFKRSESLASAVVPMEPHPSDFDCSCVVATPPSDAGSADATD